MTSIVCALAMSAAAKDSPRSRTLLDEQWRFHFGDVAEGNDESEAANNAAVPAPMSCDFDDSQWRVIDLPHDWSIELPITEEDPFLLGVEAFKEGGSRFFQNGVGWYRKTLRVEPSWVGKRVTLEFEGVYRNAEVFVNGEKVGEHPWGFIPFTVDLTPHVEGLTVGASVVIAVRSKNDQRIHRAAGIYRHVWLHVFGQTHIKDGGLYPVTTALSDKEATLHVEASVGNFERNAQGVPKVSVEFSVFELGVGGEVVSEAIGKRVASGSTSGTLVSADTRLAAELRIPNPRAWSPESPSLYRVVAQLRDGAGTLLDEYAVETGIRTLAWSADRGLELNGVSIKLNGGNVRLDLGVLGGAAFDAAEARKIRVLKEAGFNAVRTAHNPFSPAFLAACDRLGMLVMDEVFFSWSVRKTAGDDHEVEVWKKWRREFVETWVRRDRYHPSVIFWSIGNEIPESGKPEGAAIARELAGFVRALDASRLVTMGQDEPWSGGGWKSLDGTFRALDVAGYNYALISRDPQKQEPGRNATFKVYSGPPRYLDDRERAPERLMFASESFQFEVFTNWKVTQHNPYVLGDFVWTAMDYLGDAISLGVPYPQGVDISAHQRGGEEYTNKPWHWRGTYCGDIDLIGWRKPASYYREIIWNGEREPKKGETGSIRKLYMAVLIPPPPPFESPQTDGTPEAIEAPAPNAWELSDLGSTWTIPPALPTWTWPEREGEPLTIEVYSRYEAVHLYLNGRKIGEQPTGEAQEFKASFSVPYEAGELVAVGLQKGKEVERFALKTASEPTQLRTVVDHEVGNADGQDIIFVEIEAVDKAGQWHPWAAHNIEVQVEGAGSLVGLGTANLIGSVPLPYSRCALFQGRALAAIRTAREQGPITIRIRSMDGHLTPSELRLGAK